MTGLVGWWPLNGEEGNAKDLSRTGNNGTVNGATREVAGRGGLQASSFDGSDDYINAGDSSGLSALNQFTISSWIRLRELPSVDGSNAAVATKWHGSGGARENIMRINAGSDVIQFYLADESSGTVSNWSSNSSLAAERWYHLLVTYDGSELNFYIDGVLDVSRTASVSVQDTTAPFQIGARNEDSADYFNGDICDVRVYNRVLSLNEIQTLYEWGSIDIATPPGSEGGGISYWKLDEDSGSTAADEWGSNDGTVSGATVGVSGIRDTAYSFDGTDDYVDTETVISPDKITLAAWIKPDSPSGYSTSYRTVISPLYLEGYGLFYNSNVGDISSDFRNQNGDIAQPSASGVSDSDWLFVASTFDGSSARVYVNGAERDNVALSGNLENPTTSTHIGFDGDTGSDRYFNGIIDDARIYNYALEPDEIHELYQFGTRGRDMRKETVNAR